MRDRIQNKQWILELVVFLIALVFVAFSFRFSGTPQTVLLTLGLSALAASGITLLQAVLEIDPSSAVERRIQELEKQQQALNTTGLKSFYPRGGRDTSFFYELERATSIDLFHNTGTAFIKNNIDDLLKACRTNGCKVRMMISDTSRDYWNDEIATNLLCPSTSTKPQAEEIISESKDIVHKIQARAKPTDRKNWYSGKKQKPRKGSFELRVYPGVPTASIVIIDGNRARVTGYLPGMNSAQVPVLIVNQDQGREALERYQQSFDNAWDASTPVEGCTFPIPASATQGKAASLAPAG